ncbi:MULTISPECIES: MerR family transcriptional regulator [unclassified Streptomyces]|uniref:MerR family transcriptional regulator n=1 Tax=unclassified Streptomyces TaxID=2593676 RepID=UPI001F0434D7|nr:MULTISPECIES: MerR family transcriptional regulator [unclassified Streptomyces]MCH0565212.1 MerR family transcriptional regulator [Streptomyces sp. MUM 2J]MCH0568295.1 MerR family transcriptional regulator [Streptomyces sp. MUM 136J]
MPTMTIGAFAKACRLSPKALRLYDELGLLRPARVDADTGYRYYAAGQLERARLVAWLRRLGMPLADIRHVCTLVPAAAAREVRAFWARVEAETAARRDLASFLVEQLSAVPRKDTTMLELHYCAHSDRGRVRPANQDAAHAGRRLLAVADGYGRAGGPASAAALEALRVLDTAEPAAGGVLGLLEDALQRAAQAVRDATGGPGDAGTTLTALLWTGGPQLALAHIGDSRAYVLRDGELFRITHDHTLVQSMLDEGRLTEEEAASHPQRSLLLKALGPGTPAAPDLRLHDARPGDRYLLCSDGLSAVVPEDRIRALLSSAPVPDDAVRVLIDAANDVGGPDNVSCVVADVAEAA